MIGKDQTEPGPSGSLTRTLEVQIPINGVQTTVEIQVVALTDQDGNIIGVQQYEDAIWRKEVLQELKRIRIAMGQLVGDPFLGTDPLASEGLE